jgi:hypothetical protein
MVGISRVKTAAQRNACDSCGGEIPVVMCARWNHMGYRMRRAIFLTVAAILLAAPASAQKPGNWGYLETGEGVIGWGDIAVDGQVATARRFILARSPKSTPMGPVQWMAHPFRLDCQTGTFTQNAGEYLALDGTTLGKSVGHPLETISEGSTEAMLRASICEGRPIEGSRVAANREEAMEKSRAIVAQVAQ